MYFSKINLYIYSLLIFVWICLNFSLADSGGGPSLIANQQDLSLEVHSSSNISLSLSGNVSYPVTIHFRSDPDRTYKIVEIAEEVVVENETKVILVNTTAVMAGHTTIKTNTTPSMNTFEAFVRIAVYKAASLNVMSTVIGWLYFICWSVSFYPQVYENWRRKSVVGLNFDFLALNITGFISYSLYNIGFKYSTEVQNEYHSLYSEGIIPVEVNDVVFAVHATFITAFTIGQCFFYERGEQYISRMTVAALALVWSTAAVFLLITCLDLNKYHPWLTFLYYFSYVKLLVTLTKYIPQVVYNYQRKSTVGWSIGTVLLDFVGGFFSIMQMFIIAYNYNDWKSLFGNFTKFGLGFASIAFDVIFMVQHYCLYSGYKKSESMKDLVQHLESDS